MYYRFTTPDDELTGTADAIRAAHRAFRDAGGMRFYISGPFEFPPEYRPPETRRGPILDDRLCAKCLHRFRAHSGLGSPFPGATSCDDCADCTT